MPGAHALVRGERVWLLLGTDDEYHVLPVEVRDGANIVASGHSVSSWCACRPNVEQHPSGGVQLVTHIENTWPGANPELGRSLN